MPVLQLDIPRYLSLLPLFRDTPAAQLQHLAPACQTVRLGRGDRVFNAGQPCSAFHIVVTGQVRLYVGSAAGQEKVTELAGPGSSLAEESLFSDAPYTVSAQALTESVLLAIHRPALLAEIAGDARLGLRMLAGIGGRASAFMQDIEAQATHSGRQRVVGYLLRELRAAPPAAATVALPASKATIASRLSLSPEYFSRVLHELACAGLIRIDQRAIRIPDPGRLGRCAMPA